MLFLGLGITAERGAKIGVIFYGSNGYVVMTSYNGGAAFDLDGNVADAEVVKALIDREPIAFSGSNLDYLGK
mgnify:CR=1 FL=1